MQLLMNEDTSTRRKGHENRSLKNRLVEEASHCPIRSWSIVNITFLFPIEATNFGPSAVRQNNFSSYTKVLCNSFYFLPYFTIDEICSVVERIVSDSLNKKFQVLLIVSNNHGRLSFIGFTDCQFTKFKSGKVVSCLIA